MGGNKHMQDFDQALQTSINNSSFVITNHMEELIGKENVASTLNFFKSILKKVKPTPFGTVEMARKYTEVVNDPILLADARIYESIVGEYIKSEIDRYTNDLLISDDIDISVDIHVNTNLTISADISFNDFGYSVNSGREDKPCLSGHPRRDLAMIVVMVECSGNGFILPSNIIGDVFPEECLSLFRNGELDWINELWRKDGLDAIFVSVSDDEDNAITDHFKELFCSKINIYENNPEEQILLMKGAIQLTMFYNESKWLLYEDRIIKRAEDYFQFGGKYYNNRHEMIKRICPKENRGIFVPVMKKGSLIDGVVMFCDAYDFIFNRDEILETMDSGYCNLGSNDLYACGSIHIGLRSILNELSLTTQLTNIKRRLVKHIKYYEIFKLFYNASTIRFENL